MYITCSNIHEYLHKHVFMDKTYKNYNTYLLSILPFIHCGNEIPLPRDLSCCLEVPILVQILKPTTSLNSLTLINNKRMHKMTCQRMMLCYPSYSGTSVSTRAILFVQLYNIQEKKNN